MAHNAVARGAALLAGVAVTASVTACVACPSQRVVTLTSQVMLSANTTVLAMAGLGWETVDPDLIRQALGNRYADRDEYDVIGLPWPGQMAPFNGTLTLGQSAEVGQATMDKAINDQLAWNAENNPDGKIVAIGASGATVVVDQEMKVLADRLAAGDPTAPTPDQISFIVLGDANRGAFRGFQGTKLPIFDIVPMAPETPYDIIVLKGEYDGIGDWPDRWWNILADLNAMAGTSLVQQVLPEDIVDQFKLDAFGSVHYDSMFADLNAVPPQNVTKEVNSQGGTTTTYLIPTADLPLLRPLTALGVPKDIVDTLETVLRPIIDSAYYRNDPPSTGFLGRPSTVTASVAAATAAVSVAALPSRSTARPATARSAAATSATAAKSTGAKSTGAKATAAKPAAAASANPGSNNNAAKATGKAGGKRASSDD